jgi:hypothetical protein
MTRVRIFTTICFMLLCALTLTAQRTANSDTVVPTVIKFAGTLHEAGGKSLTGTVGVTFLLYREQFGGTPLWIETQNVQADQGGHYSVFIPES